MNYKSPSQFLTILSKRYSSISSLPSTTLLQTPSIIKEQRNPFHEPHNFTLHKHSQSLSTNICRTTHVEESHLSVSFCSNALKFSAKMGVLLDGKQLHSHILKLGFGHEQSLQNQLLNLYVKCRAFDDAQKVFDEMPKRNVVSWNIMISGFDRNLKRIENVGLVWFKEMLVDMVKPNYITFISLISSFIEVNDIEKGEQLHCFIIKSNFSSDNIVGSALVDLYGKCGLIEDARRLFDRIPVKDLVSWNVMVSCYTLNGLGGKAIGMFKLLMSECLKGDDFTFSSLLCSCGIIGSCNLGMQIHDLTIKLSFDLDVLVASSLVDMYVKTENLEEARKVFDWMVTRNVVSWTTMIVGYGRYGDGKEAMKLLRQMLRGGFYSDELTLASILSSCADLAAYIETTQVHAHAIKKGLEVFLSIGNALINAYSKCGSFTCAFQSFSLIREPNLISWTSMIGVYAFHGLPKQAIQIFQEMLLEGVRPDHIAFVGVLSACSHGGLVDEGLSYFSSMTRDHRIVPDSEHYACLVDLLGRAGHVNKAYDILVNMPSEPGVNVLGAFIGACKAHGNVGLAKWAAEKLFKLEPGDPVNYTLVSNVYASVGSWIDVARVRKMMRNQCDFKVAGCSWIELGGTIHTFVSSDKSHAQATDMYNMLESLVRLMDGCYTSNLETQVDLAL